MANSVIFNCEETKNWFTACMAIRYTRHGLQTLIATGGQSLHKQILQNVITTNQLPQETKCEECVTAALGVIACPTKGVCKKEKGKCQFHNVKTRPCPKGFCDQFSKEIKAQHRFNGPSWKNTHSDLWSSSYFEILKCFAPTDGYEDKGSVVTTDFNGIVSIIINCKWFQQFVADDLSRDSSKFKKAKEVTTQLRHNPEFKVTGDQLQEVFDVLLNILTDSKSLGNDPKAKDACDTVRRLQSGCLAVTMKDVNDVLDDIKYVRSKEKLIKAMIKEAVDKISQISEESVEDTRSKLTEMAKQYVEQAQAGLVVGDSTDQYRKLRDEFRENLIAFYQDERCTVPIVPLKVRFNEKLCKMFCQPKLSYLNKQTVASGSERHSGSPVTSYEELFFKDGTKLRNIFLLGEAGMGKSTFCSYLTSAWCDVHQNRNQNEDGANRNIYTESGHDNPVEPQKTESGDHKDSNVSFSDTNILLQFDFVFPIILRAAKHDNKDVDTLIEEQIFEKVERRSDHNIAFLKKILYEERCLVVIDGLDEWPYSIPSRVSRKKWAYLTTTRPWKMIDVQLPDTKIDAELCIDGIRCPHELISKAFECLNTKYSKETGVHIEMSSHEFVVAIKERGLEKFLDVPVMLMQLISVWFDTGSLSTSKCEIYARTLEMLLKRTALEKQEILPDAKKPENEKQLPACFSLVQTRYCIVYQSFIANLANLAFAITTLDDRSSSVVFEKSIACQYISELDCKTALESGILSQFELLSLQEDVTTFNFLHKTFQEFLCAVYIATRNTDDLHGCMEKLFHTFGERVDVLDISEVMVFTCGMNPLVGVRMSDRIGDAIAGGLNDIFLGKTESYETYWSCLGRVRSFEDMIECSFFECVNNGHAEPKLVFNHTSIGHIGRSDAATPRPWIAEKKRLLNKNGGQLLTLAACVDSPMKDIVDVVSKNNNLATVSLWAYGVLMNNTTGIDLSSCTRLTHLLCYMTPLSYIRFNPINLISCRLHGGSEALERDVFNTLASGPTSLQTLFLDQCKSPDLMIKVLPAMTSLERLWLSWADIGDREVRLPKSIRNITFRSVYMNAQSWKTLMDSLTRAWQSVECEFGWYESKINRDFPEMRKYVMDNPLFEHVNTHTKEVLLGSRWLCFSFRVRQ